MAIAIPGYVPDVDAGDEVDPDWGNAIRDRAPQVFDTTTNRDAAIPTPIVGQTCIITTGSNAGLYEYVGSTDDWTRPWNMPWGLIGVGTATSSQGSISSTYLDVTNLSVTFTAVANRTYEVHVEADILSTVGTDTWNMAITDVSNTVLRVNAGGFSTSNSEVPACVTLVTTTPSVAGSYTFKARARRSSGTGALTITSSAGIQPNQIIVKDIGPNGAPA